MHRPTTLHTAIAAAGLAACIAALPACSQTRTTTGSINQANTLNAQDWNDVAQRIVATITASGVAGRYSSNGEAPVLILGDFNNDTPVAAFTRQKDFMYNAIQTALINSNQFRVNMDIAGAGGDVETMIRDVRQLRGSDEYDQSTVADRGTLLAPDLILYGEIGGIKSQAGRTTQYDYQITTRLIDVRTGTTVPGGSATIGLSKTFTRGLLGG